MQAIVCRQYGGPEVLRCEEIARPIPKDDEVLVRIHAAGVNAADWHLLRADPFVMRLAFGLFKPKLSILGADIAGCVEAVGKNVTDFKPGDEVFGDVSACGWGAFAEYVCADEAALVLKPSNISFEEAAAAPTAAVTALMALREKGHVQPGQQVLINGASGGVGTFAIQIAKALGANVTAVCSTHNIEQARALGADRVIDYREEDFTRNTQRYDVVLAANGYQSLFDYQRVLNDSGTYVMSGGSGYQLLQVMLLGPFLSMGGNKKFVNFIQTPDNARLKVIAQWLESGKIQSVIDKHFSLQNVPEAIRYLETGHAKAKVVVTIV